MSFLFLLRYHLKCWLEKKILIQTRNQPVAKYAKRDDEPFEALLIKQPVVGQAVQG
jgi:hypothetical protein